MTKLAFDDRFGAKMEVCDLCNDPRIITQDGNKICASCHCVNEIKYIPNRNERLPDIQMHHLSKVAHP